MSKINLGNEYPCMCCQTCNPDCSLNLPDRNLEGQMLEREERAAFLEETKTGFRHQEVVS